MRLADGPAADPEWGQHLEDWRQLQRVSAVLGRPYTQDAERGWVLPAAAALDCEALRDSTLLVLRPDAFRSAIPSEPAVAAALCRYLSDELVGAQQTLAGDVLLPVRSRVACHLLNLAERDERELVVCATPQHLAAAVGSVRELVARVLRDMEQAGLVQRRAGQLVLVDAAALHRVWTSESGLETTDKESDMNDNDLREANVAIVRRYIDAINAWDFDTKRTLLAEDAVFEIPYAPEGFDRRIVGRDNIIAFMETIPAIVDAENLHDVRLETLSSDPGEIVAEYKSDMVIKPHGVPYRNEYVSRFTVRDGQITRFAEYYDPIRLVLALGGSVRSAGIDDGQNSVDAGVGRV